MHSSHHPIRRFHDNDSLHELTELLHRAYAPLAAMGLQFMAAKQDVEMTRQNISSGECYLMFDEKRLVGTILVYPPSYRAPYCDWYNRPDVAFFSKFAVEPELQRRGLGGCLLNFAENRARELGAAEVSLDTAESASHLIEFYKKSGYREIGYEQWDHTNYYRSILLSKRLSTVTRCRRMQPLIARKLALVNSVPFA